MRVRAKRDLLLTTTIPLMARKRSQVAIDVYTNGVASSIASHHHEQLAKAKPLYPECLDARLKPHKIKPPKKRKRSGTICSQLCQPARDRRSRPRPSSGCCRPAARNVPPPPPSPIQFPPSRTLMEIDPALMRPPPPPPDWMKARTSVRTRIVVVVQGHPVQLLFVRNKDKTGPSAD
ncbi:hypothetical protein PENSPDRAFT_671882 [Peniophora sp. CONT]|nr:hypothetical protein PENSPDRAFT_671882 [Peniophora sp. CONT]